MEASIEAQRASVQRQIQSAQRTEAFFVTAPTRAAVMPVLGLEAEPDCERLPQKQMEPLITQASEREGLTPDLLRAIIQRESSFRPCAISPKGAMGLMQLMPATALQFRVQDPFDPEENVNAGARFLRQLITRYAGDLALALGAYNAGPGRVDAAGGLPPIPETRDYVSGIQQLLAAKSQDESSPDGHRAVTSENRDRPSPR